LVGGGDIVRGGCPREVLGRKLGGWCVWAPSGTEARARKREILLREPDAGNLHARFDEREVETEQGRDTEAPATERAGNG
jgi:hypothetical protein